MRHAPQEIRTFFVTSVTNLRRRNLESDPMARLLIDVMQENRAKGRLLLHEFVVMLDHFRLIVTPASNVSLEKAVGCIKGGFAFRAKRELGYRFLVWEEGFTNHRIRDENDYETHRVYVHRGPRRARLWLAGVDENPVKVGLSATAAEYPYSSAFPGALIDPRPPWLKPHS